jgi:exodeoxyribonuclease V alpha subunit
MTIDGLNERDIVKIQKAFGPGALGLVKENPYILSRLFPLKTVDAVASKLGVFKVGNVHRGVAIAEYMLDRAMLDGHCYVHTHTLVSQAKTDCKLKEFDKDDLSLHGTIVVDGVHAMLRTIYEAESFVANQLQALLELPELPAKYTHVQVDGDIVLDEQQKLAVERCLQARVLVVTGPPGSGKTTITEHVLEEFDAQHVHYALCAPTGKAAKRFAEVTGRPATTIHRLLKWQFDPESAGGFSFYYGVQNPLPLDVVLVDESSMIDIRLAADILAAIDPARTRIIFIGDADQLQPVGPGSFFGDMIASGVVPTVRLQTVHRAAEASWIYRNAPKILTGKDVELDTEVEDFMWYELATTQAHGIGEIAVQVIRRLLEAGHTWDEFQLITPMRIKEGGANALNLQIRAELLDAKGLTAEIGAYEDAVKVCRGDRVIQTKNNYQLEVYNGECGEVAIVETPSRVRVRFDNEYRDYKGVTDLRNLALSYALTVHKVQGSEWPIVIVVCHSVHGRMLNRKLFYTAVTRARKQVIVIGDERGVKQAISNTQYVTRRTQLIPRLKGMLQ